MFEFRTLKRDQHIHVLNTGQSGFRFDNKY